MLKKIKFILHHIKGLFLSNWRAKHIIFSGKNSKKYFGDAKIDDWKVKCIPEKFSIKPKITWIGQSSFLVQVEGINILLDPNFYGMAPFIRRNLKPGIAIQDLPKIDFILISHNHNDHMNYKSLKELKNKYKQKPVFLIPYNDRKWFDINGFENVLEKKWWEEENFEFKFSSNIKNIKFTFVPAKHWSARTLFDIGKSFTGGWMININDLVIYFAGDTAYSDNFVKIAQKYQKIDIAFLPIAPGKIDGYTGDTHIDTKEALKVFIELKAKCFIPMHWGTFRIGLDKFSEPVENLKSYWKQEKSALQGKTLSILKFGESIIFD